MKTSLHITTTVLWCWNHLQTHEVYGESLSNFYRGCFVRSGIFRDAFHNLNQRHKSQVITKTFPLAWSWCFLSWILIFLAVLATWYPCPQRVLVQKHLTQAAQVQAQCLESPSPAAFAKLISLPLCAPRPDAPHPSSPGQEPWVLKLIQWQNNLVLHTCYLLDPIHYLSVISNQGLKYDL